MSDKAKALIKRFEKLKSERVNWESLWQEASDLVLPRDASFTYDREQGTKRNKNFDSTAILANERFAAVMESMLTPRTQLWHSLKSPDEDINNREDVRKYFEDATKVLFRLRYSHRANFASQKFENYLSLGAIGTACMFVDERRDGTIGTSYRALHMSEVYFANNFEGRVDTVFRPFKLTVRQAMQRFPEGLPEQITKKAADKPDETFPFLHAVLPREEYDPQRLDPKNKPYASYYISMEGKVIVEESGYDEFPYMISRYVTGVGEIYGRSPAMTALSDIKSLQTVTRTNIRAMHQVVEPSLLAMDDGAIGSLNMVPGAINYGWLDANGNEKAKAFNSGARPDMGEAMMEQKREFINDVFLIRLFQILVDSPQMTATEVLERTREKGILLAPTMGRQQSEDLGPLIEREIGIANRLGMLPQMPQALIEAQGDYEAEYDSPMSRAAKAEEALGVVRTLEVVYAHAERDPSILDNYDGDGIAEVLNDANGVPAKVRKRKEERDQMRQARAEAQQQAQQAEQLPGVASAMRDMAQAEQASE